jgi:hypothetical protein
MTARAVLSRIFSVVFLMIFASIFNGYVLSVLWGWFVVPTFGAPTLGVAPAIGIALVVGYMTHQMRDRIFRDEDKKEEPNFRQIMARGTAFAILKPSNALFFGWIVHLFM